MSLLSAAIKELNAAQPAYITAQSYYDGSVKERFASQRLEQILAGTGVRYKINFCATPVDAVVERLEIASFAGEPTALAKWMQVWEDNEFPLEAKQMVHAPVERLGDSFVIGWPDEDMASGFAMYAHSPLNVRVFYDPERPRRKSHAIHRYVALAPAADDQDEDSRRLVPGRLYGHVTLYFRDHVERWVTTDPLDNGPQGERIPMTEDTPFVRFTEDEDNPWDLIPVWHFRTGRPYGRPQHADAYTVQDMINATLANLMNSLNHAGYPQRYALADLAQQQMVGGFGAPEGVADGTGITATNTQGFKAGPGETWLIEGAKSVGQFPTADAANFTNPITALLKWMGTVTDTPFHLFDMSGNLPSGESQKTATQPLNAKVKDQHVSLGSTWREMADDILTMLNVAHTPGAIQVIWAPVEVFDTKETWEVVKAKIEVGVPVREAFIQAGVLPHIVDVWLRNAPVVQLVTGEGEDDGADLSGESAAEGDQPAA